MTNDKTQWQGVTLYLVTTDNPKVWASADSIYCAARELASAEPHEKPHVWEVQIGQAPVDVTDEARKLVEGKQ